MDGGDFHLQSVLLGHALAGRQGLGLAPLEEVPLAHLVGVGHALDLGKFFGIGLVGASELEALDIAGLFGIVGHAHDAEIVARELEFAGLAEYGKCFIAKADAYQPRHVFRLLGLRVRPAHAHRLPDPPDSF